MASNVDGEKLESKESRRPSSSDLVGSTGERTRSSDEVDSEKSTKGRRRFWRREKKRDASEEAKVKKAEEQLPPVPFLQLFRYVLL